MPISLIRSAIFNQVASKLSSQGHIPDLAHLGKFKVEVLGIEPMTSWIVDMHADHSASGAVLQHI